MAVRVSQLVIEAPLLAIAKARVSQAVLEADVVGTPQARVSQEVAEVFAAGSTPRISQLVLEARAGGSTPRLSLFIIEVLIVNKVVSMPAIFPTLPGLTYSVIWSPIFFNMPTQTTASGADIDVALADEPLHNFELVYEYLDDRFGQVDFKTFMGFFLQIGGASGRFLFKNPDDHQVVGEVLATTDGVLSTWQIKRTFGAGGYGGTECVGYVDLTAPVRVYLDDAVQDPSTYTILTTEPVNQQVKFWNTPTTGKVLKIDCDYFYYCKFVENNLTFEKFMHQLWEVKSVQLHSCRAGA